MKDWETLATDRVDAHETWLFQARHKEEDGEIETRWICEGSTLADLDTFRSTTYTDAEAIALRDWLNKQYPLAPQDGRPGWTYLGGDRWKVEIPVNPPLSETSTTEVREHPSLAEIRQSPEYRALKDNFGRMFGCRSMWHLKSKLLKKARHQQMTWPQLFEGIILNVLWLNQAREAGDTNLADNQEQLLEDATGEFLRRIYLLLGLKETPPQAKSQPTNQ